MRLRAAPASGLRVSELALGTLTFGRESDEPTSMRILDRFLDAGGTLVDTADSYHVAEEVLGRLLPARRERVTLTSKVGLPVSGVDSVGLSRLHIRRQLERSLRRLHVDHLDLYQLHLFDPFTPLEESLSTMGDLVREGKIRYFGVSNWTAWQVTKGLGVSALLGSDPLVSVSLEYSLVARGADRELIPMAISEGLVVLPWSPLGGGLLSGKYRAEREVSTDTRMHQETTSGQSLRRRAGAHRNRAIVDALAAIAERTGATPSQAALAWVLSRPGIGGVIVGVRTVEQLEDNLGATELALAEDDLALLDEVSALDPGYPHDWNVTYGLRSPTQGPLLS